MILSTCEVLKTLGGMGRGEGERRKKKKERKKFEIIVGRIIARATEYHSILVFNLLHIQKSVLFWYL